jgi:hypothetical protein
MRIQKLLFATTLFFVTLVALANIASLGVSSAFYIPLLGVFQLPFLLIGLLSVMLTALLFFWAAKASFTQAQANRVKDLERLIDLQRVLDLRSKQERTNLQISLDNHVNAIMARLETLRSNEKSVSSSTRLSHPVVEETFSGLYNREALPSLQLQNSNLNSH